MAGVLSSDRRRLFAVAFAAGASMLLASLANFLNHNDYPFFRPEVGLIVLAMLAFAAVMAAWYVPQRQWGRSFLEGLLAALFVDLNSDSIQLLIFAGLAVAAITAWRRISLLGPLAVLCAVVLLTTLAGLGGRPSWIMSEIGDSPGVAAAAGKPAIVHIILDEHIGIEGFANEGPDGARLGDELRAFYLANGFAIYGGAYSQYSNSANAIPHILNFGRRLGQGVNARGLRSGQTDHFAKLVDEGYRLTIIESDYADLCTGARFHECITYSSASLRPTLASPMPIGQRIELIASKAASLSAIVSLSGAMWNVVVDRSALGRTNRVRRFTPQLGHSSSVAATLMMPRLIQQSSAAREGEAYFAHLLFPHHPYVVDSGCRYRSRPWHGIATGAPLPVRRAAYYGQVRCVQKALAGLLGAVARSPAGANSVIIIHGDHGSRLTRRDLADIDRSNLTDADAIATFSTLFAARGPDIAPTYVKRPQPIATLLGQFARSNFKSAPTADGPIGRVVLVDRDLVPRDTVPMPASWARRLERPTKE